MRSLLLPVGAALLGSTAVLAADQATCSLENKCPEETPCCSVYGQCGVGAYCMGGCDPRMSFSLDSCAPAPVCQDRTMAMDSMDRIVDISEYLGDASKADWVSQGEPVINNGNLLLTMPPNSVGTVLSSTVYMWYGNIKGRIKTSRGPGVITAFILFSDVKDEIDYEWVGTGLETAQTNYYFQGIPDYTQSANISLSNTFSTWHEYEIQWTPDEIVWLVDGQVGRRKKKSDTWNETAQQWDFPQTPARVQLSLWPGGLASNAEGTISWAGGPINWDHEDVKNVGYFYAQVGEITMECYNADSAPGTNKGKSYYYNDYRATNDTVVDSDKKTILGSFIATGTDMDAGKPKGSKSATPSSTAAQIPGGGNGNPGNTPSTDTTTDDDGDSDSSDGDSGSSTSPSSGSCGTNGFSQSCDTSSSSSSDENAGSRPEKMSGASAFAVVVALGGLLML